MAAIQSLRYAEEKTKIVAVDMDKLAPGLFLADHAAVVPAADSPAYISRMLELARKWKVEVIIPTVDEEVEVLSKRVAEFEKEGIHIPIPDSNSVIFARDKLKLPHLATEGIEVPKTLLIHSTSDIDRLFAEVGLPCIMKQRKGRGGRGFSIISSRSDARSWLEKNRGQEMIIQEKVDGDLLMVQGLAKGGELITSTVQRRLAVRAPGSGTATSAITVEDDTARVKLGAIVKALSWRGALGVEFIHPPDSGKYYAIDINPRICGQSHLSAVAGVNFPVGLVQLSLGRPLTIGTSYKPGLVFIRPWSDLVVPEHDLASFGSKKI
jgi:carbamoyl-phosphate synthase large subunit